MEAGPSPRSLPRVVEAALYVGGLPHQVQCSYHHGYKEIQVDSVEGQTTMNTVGPIMLATQGEEIQVQFSRDRTRVPDPLSDTPVDKSTELFLHEWADYYRTWMTGLFTSLSPRTSEACHFQLRFICK